MMPNEDKLKQIKLRNYSIEETFLEENKIKHNTAQWHCPDKKVIIKMKTCIIYPHCQKDLCIYLNIQLNYKQNYRQKTECVCYKAQKDTQNHS